jgi:hypothetical protein
MAMERASSSKRRRSEAKADQHVEAEKPVKTAPMGGFDDGGGMMMFEELDGVDVKWEEGANGQKTAKFVVSHLHHSGAELTG